MPAASAARSWLAGRDAGQPDGADLAFVSQGGQLGELVVEADHLVAFGDQAGRGIEPPQVDHAEPFGAERREVGLDLVPQLIRPVTLEQIARDAGVGIGTLYRHFPTREALVEALYRLELADLCASADSLLSAHPPERALRAWMDRFADYVTAKQEMADTLRAVFASGSVTVSQAREQLTAAVRTILDAGGATGTLRDDVRAEDIVATVVGMFAATSLAGGHEQGGSGHDG